MKLSYPVEPVHVNQPYGVNGSYYARFVDSNGNPEKGHMGIDFQAAHGQPVYAVHDGFAFYLGPDTHGGDGIYLRFEDEENPGTYYTTIYWHLCSIDDPKYKPLVERIGRNVKKGDLLGYADNSGAPYESSGDHLHFGLAPCDVNGEFLQKGNGFGGCIDPQPFFEEQPGGVLSVVKTEVQVLNTTTDPSVRQSLIQLIIKQIRDFFGWG